MKRIILIVTAIVSLEVKAQNKTNVIAYFTGNSEKVEQISAAKLSHIIFSFCHLKGNRLSINSKEDSITIVKLVGLKKKNPKLKVMLSLGGWGGCASCSPVFSKEENRKEFALSVKEISQQFKTDGLDLDWEYPAIEGFPEHEFRKEDRANFTALLKILRETIGTKQELSFAAGGFKKYLDESVDWAQVMPLVDRVNLMTYDLVGGYSTVTGHHTPLYSSKLQTESVDNAVKYLLKLGVPKEKLVIGAAFYARVWENVLPTNNGLYQSGKFKRGVDFKNFDSELSNKNGYTYYWDDSTKAPYFYNHKEKLFATGDNEKSIQLKTEYALNQGLQGIMFWELTLDKESSGLLDVIVKTIGSN